MRNTTMALTRAGATMRAKIPVQIDNMSAHTQAELGGQSDYFAFWIYPTGGAVIDVRFRDLLIDENEVDALTGANTAYRVFGRPEQFDGGYAEIPVESVVGK